MNCLMLLLRKKTPNKLTSCKLFVLIVIVSCLLSCKTKLNLSQIKTENIPISKKTEFVDSSIVQLIKPYRENMQSDMQVVVGNSKVPLTKGKPESLLTNYLADLLLTQGQQYAAKQVNQPVPVVAYLNYGGIRASLPQGKITVKAVFELMPFENEMVLIRISGKQLIAFAAKIASVGGDCVAGIRLGLTAEGKVAALTVGGKTVQPEASYWMVTNDYVANGGDNMTMLAGRDRYVDTGIKLRDLLINTMKKEYKKGVIIAPKLDGRIYYES